MGAGHAHRTFRPGSGAIHRLPPHYKLAAALAFTLVVVATPREAFWAFAVYAALLAAVAAVAGVPPAFVARRMLIEIPFVVFALALPIFGRPPYAEILGLTVSEEGLLAGWNILVKATLGVITSILLAATTEPRMLLVGAERLRLPSLLVQIATFMLRYLNVIVDEMRRMRVARESRGFTARHIAHLPVVARSAGALFIRSFERGERVHLAMLSRGYGGSLPAVYDMAGTRRQAMTAAALPIAALAALVGVLWTHWW